MFIRAWLGSPLRCVADLPQFVVADGKPPVVCGMTTSRNGAVSKAVIAGLTRNLFISP
jgi:hypothetical protein